MDLIVTVETTDGLRNLLKMHKDGDVVIDVVDGEMPTLGSTGLPRARKKAPHKKIKALRLIYTGAALDDSVKNNTVKVAAEALVNVATTKSFTRVQFDKRIAAALKKAGYKPSGASACISQLMRTRDPVLVPSE